MDLTTLIIVGFEGAPTGLAVPHTSRHSASIAVWQAESGGSRLGEVSQPDFPWYLAVECVGRAEGLSLLDGILATGDVNRLGRPETFAQIYALPDAVDVAADDRDVFYGRVAVACSAIPSFNCWYNEVHLSEVGSAGLRAGRRFRSLDVSNAFLALYRLGSLNEMRGSAIGAVRGLGGFESEVESFARLEARTLARWPRLGSA